MKKKMATMLAAASISMAIAVPAMAESSHMKTNSTTNQVNETKGHYDSRGYNDSLQGGYSNMSRSRSMNDNTNGYNGYGTGTGTYGTNSVNANSTDGSSGNWGWLGLLGLIGLAGMRRDKQEGKPQHAK
ncbi:WGxxGxxG family protein [Paenibacillus polygoni]|uniref:WGxxGxxG family protein n=1 Tax=Paenibacillus polygoni TaxID=3050112 RepID=A0ABY8X3Z8_9BACL|nr:WGxxGxxG family protein [Paenibacillus polygoni]WIV18191.1 WGxxGxxG family protein [Paenibacillus polygoni]